MPSIHCINSNRPIYNEVRGGERKGGREAGREEEQVGDANCFPFPFIDCGGNYWDSLWQPCMRNLGSTQLPLYMAVHPLFSSYLHAEVLNKILHEKKHYWLSMYGVSSVGCIFE